MGFRAGIALLAAAAVLSILAAMQSARPVMSALLRFTETWMINIANMPGSIAEQHLTAASATCNAHVRNSTQTFWGSLPWVAPCKCTEEELLWGYGVACDPELTHGFDAKDILVQNEGDINACVCVPVARSMSAGKQSTAAPSHQIVEDVSIAEQPVVMANATCNAHVPNSVPTYWGSFPWVAPCKCTEEEVLWGYGVACDPELTHGFDAKGILVQNEMDINACGCVPVAQSLAAPSGQSIEGAKLHVQTFEGEMMHVKASAPQDLVLVDA